MWSKIKKRMVIPRHAATLILMIAIIAIMMFVAPVLAAAAPFDPVENIIDVPDQAVAGIPLNLTGTVYPFYATNKTITWSIKNAGSTGATITGSTLNTMAAGTVVVTATVEDGLEGGMFSSLAAGRYHTQAVKPNGTLWGWGSGRLGDGKNITQQTPLQMGTANNWTAVSVGDMHTLAIKADGSLWAWGSNDFGKLGDGTTAIRAEPVQIGTESSWATIAAGYHYSMAIKKDGTLWAWGYNSNGQLGDGTTTSRNIPVQVGTANDWETVAAGDSHTVALKTDGTLWAWGRNTNGQLGDGTTSTRYRPVQIGVLKEWKAIAVGYNHTLAIKADDSLWAWGRNSNGELGDGTGVDRYTPVQIGTDNNWATVAAGYWHSGAHKTDGSLWAWGDNSYAQLGDGTTIKKNVPIRVGTANDWTIATAGVFHNFALKTNGSLWAWGSIAYGQLGVPKLGEEDNYRATPVRIGSDTNWSGAGFINYHKDFIITVSSGTITVKGSIRYQQSPRAAQVTLSYSQGATITSVSTSSDGSYTFTVPAAPAGTTYTLKVTKECYLSYTIKNLTFTTNELLPTIDISHLAGDVNGDGCINAEDLTLLLNQFNKTPTVQNNADIDRSGIVNAVDLAYLLASFNNINVEINMEDYFYTDSTNANTKDIEISVFKFYPEHEESAEWQGEFENAYSSSEEFASLVYMLYSTAHPPLFSYKGISAWNLNAAKGTEYADFLSGIVEKEEYPLETIPPFLRLVRDYLTNAAAAANMDIVTSSKGNLITCDYALTLGSEYSIPVYIRFPALDWLGLAGNGTPLTTELAQLERVVLIGTKEGSPNIIMASQPSASTMIVNLKRVNGYWYCDKPLAPNYTWELWVKRDTYVGEAQVSNGLRSIKPILQHTEGNSFSIDIIQADSNAVFQAEGWKDAAGDLSNPFFVDYQ